MDPTSLVGLSPGAVVMLAALGMIASAPAPSDSRAPEAASPAEPDRSMRERD